MRPRPALLGVAIALLGPLGAPRAGAGEEPRTAGPAALVAPGKGGPPPTLPPRDPERIVVTLSAGAARRAAAVAVGGPVRVVSVDGRRLYRAGDDLEVLFEIGEGGTLRVDGEDAGRGPVALLPLPGRGFGLEGRSYDGELRVSVAAGGDLLLQNALPFGAYLEGVLATELFPDSPAEALRAQAVLARSFALVHLGDLTDDPAVHQAYRGRPPAAAAERARDAVRGTAGLRLVASDGSPLPNYWYHSTCGGRTADASFVFGVPGSVAYSGVACGRCGASRYYTWESEVPEEALRRALRFGSPVARLEIGARSLDGRVLTFRATASGGTVRYVPAIQVRQALGANRLRSTLLGSVEPSGGTAARPASFRFRGRGWGHGVGLCQVGACGLAREGRTAGEILAFYFPGTRLVRAAR
jgi:stage II sporulation protein D